MLIFFVPLSIKTEQTEGCFLGINYGPKQRRPRAFALFNEVTEFDACVPRNVTGLGGFREEVLNFLPSNSDRLTLSLFLNKGGDTYLDWICSGWLSSHFTRSRSSYGDCRDADGAASRS
jgi:hypothetical protein